MSQETWKSIPGFADYYQASDFGRVRSLRYGKVKVLKPHVRKRGYSHVLLYPGDGRWGVYGKSTPRCYFVHQLVYMAFVGPIEEGKEIDHIDQDPTNNTLSNLQALTTRENLLKMWAHRRATGRGAMRGTAKERGQFTLDDLVSMTPIKERA